MPPRVRPYLYYDTAVSICTTCYRRIDAKIVFEEDKVFMLKRCPSHGFERVLISDDVDYYRRCREVFIKPPEMPDRYNTAVNFGCPYDCGLCPDHEQDPAVRASIEGNSDLRHQIFKLFSTNHSPQSQANTLRELLCCLPQVLAPKNLGYDNLFRILIVQFIDAQTFDLRSIKKTCIHIAHPDGKRLIPFDTYNMFYRDDLEQTPPWSTSR
jgi:uncharacterized radical SAM superfamily Fe-S cluster-containing enzyme